MLYRFHFTNEENKQTQITEGQFIYNKYFTNDYNDKLSEIINEIQSNYDDDDFNPKIETFDPALSLAY